MRVRFPTRSAVQLVVDRCAYDGQVLLGNTGPVGWHTEVVTFHTPGIGYGFVY